MAGGQDIGWSLRCVSRLVGALFDLDPHTFTGPKKGSPAHVHARQVTMYLMHTEGGLDQADVAAAFNRHHSTVWHAKEVITVLREHEDVDRALTRLGEMFRELRDAHALLPDLVEALAA